MYLLPYVTNKYLLVCFMIKDKDLNQMGWGKTSEGITQSRKEKMPQMKEKTMRGE